ncbi:MAG: hypothetical protein IKK57_12390 [Clostridia bacterium]|nr:hypothetical protein [Clostridia bacterium]
MDRFLEEVVTKHDRRMDEIMYWVSLVVMVFCGFLALMQFAMLGMSQNLLLDIVVMVAMAGLAVYTYFYRDKLRTEYEYTFTNGSLDFAMVYNNKRRKNLGALNVAKVDAFGKVSSGSFHRHTSAPDVKHMRWFLNRGAELYYFAYSKEGKKSVIVFEPSEEMVGMIKHYLPRGVYQEN